MRENKFLIYLDILGFEELAEEIEKNENIRSERVRKEFFIDPLKKEIQKLKKEGKIVGRKSIADGWILVVESFENLFESISKILRIEIDIIRYINTPKKDYGNVQFEIAIGSYEFDKWAEMDGDEIICDDNTIRYLKTYLLTEYENFYKKEFARRVTESLVIATDSFVDKLNSVTRKYFVKKDLVYFEKAENKIKKYYLLNKENILKDSKISEFLKKIGQTRSDYSGALIDRLFVSPDEFDEIKEKLERERIVFITGTAGYGKTYTAIRLLWESYNKGFIPEWIAGKEAEHRVKVREKLANIDATLKPHHIIYFEDPFGKTKYEKRDDLKERINFIINSVKNKGDVYVIITSRKDVFEEFEKESYSVEEIRKFEKEMNILKPSYSYKKKKEILEKWAEEKECEWFRDEKQKKMVFESLEYEGILPTPLSIHDFAEATARINEEIYLREKINAYSKEVERAFADEIKGLYDSERFDRVLFLSFIFVSYQCKIGFVKQVYEILKKTDYEDFEKILMEEYRAKVSEIVFRGKILGLLEFSHPSYSKALPYILDHVGCKNIICEVLRELSLYDSTANYVADTIANNFDKLAESFRNDLLIKLSTKAAAIGGVTRAVANNFNKLPQNVQNLLFQFAEGGTARKVANAILNNFDKLPNNIINKLLIKLAENEEVARDIAGIVAANFDKLSADIRNKLLLQLAENEEAARDIAVIVTANFNNLPENVRNELLIKLAEKRKAAGNVADAIAYNFDKLTVDIRNILLLQLAENEEVARDIAVIVTANFNNLPENVRNELLIKLAEKRKAAGNVADIICYNFDRLPEDTRNNLLLKLAEKGEARKGVSGAIVNNFDKMPQDVQNLMFQFAECEETAWGVAEAIVNNFDKLPENVRNELLLKINENGKSVISVARIAITVGTAWVVINNYNKLPENVRSLLLKFAEKEEFAYWISNVVADNFDKLPENVRNELLLKLAKKEGAAQNVVKVVNDNFDNFSESIKKELLLQLIDNNKATGITWTLVNNFNKLSEDIQCMLSKLAEKDRAIWWVAEAIANNFDTLPEDVRNLLFKFSESDDSALIIAKVVADNFDKLPEDVRNNLLLRIYKKNNAVGYLTWTIVNNFDKVPEDLRNLLFELSNKENTAINVARAVAYNFDTLPEDVRNNLLLILSKKNNAIGYVTWAIANNFDKLPEDVRNLLDEQQETLQKIIKEIGDKKVALRLISNLGAKIDRDFVSKILSELTADMDSRVREKAEKMLKAIFKENKG